MTTIRNAIKFACNKEMWKPYLLWSAARLTMQKPRIHLGARASVGEWISFSEYYSYRNGISANELAFIRRVRDECGNQDCIGFDVGANVGLFTCTMADAAFTAVHSFEPIPDTFVRLKRNVLSNGISNRCVLNCAAVGEGHGLARFAENVQSPGVNRLATAATPFAHQIQQVPILSLDEYCTHHDISRIDLAKIDVEGMEELVLRGAKELLQRRAVKRILIEISPVNQPHVGLHIDGLLACVSNINYEPRKLEQDGTIGSVLSAEYLRTRYQENVVLIPAIGL